MSLIDAYASDCAVMRRTSSPDGEGGKNTTWSEGEIVKAAIVLDSSAQALIAEARGLTIAYTVTVSRSVSLKYHDVLKRKSDGKVFRITSAEKHTPNSTSLDMMQYTAEGWELT